MQLKPMRVGSVHLFSEMLPDAQRSITGVRQVASLPETLQACVQLHADQRIAVIPDGPYTIPVFTGSQTGT
jgi:hypothetical protein